MIQNAPARTIPWKEHADALDALVHMVLVDAGVVGADMRDYLYRDRTHIPVYAKAMFGLALHKEQKQDEFLFALLFLRRGAGVGGRGSGDIGHRSAPQA